MSDPIKALIAAAEAVVEFKEESGYVSIESIAALRAAIAAAKAAAEARPEPARCRPHCTTMATDCDYCRPEPKPPSLLDLHGLGRDVAPHVEPAAEPSIIPALRKVAAINHGGDTSRAVDLLCDAVEALAREVRRG